MELVALLGEDKESWGQVKALLNHGTWERVILIKSTKDPFPTEKKCETININSSKSLLDLKSEMVSKLKGKFSEFEAYVSIASGKGKEHMALISALLSLPIGIRLVAYTKKGVEFIN